MGAVGVKRVLVWISADLKDLHIGSSKSSDEKSLRGCLTVPLETVSDLVYGDASRAYRLSQSLKPTAPPSHTSGGTDTPGSLTPTPTTEVPPYLCVSLTTKCKLAPQIDFVAKNEEEVERWLLGLNSLIPNRRSDFTRHEFRKRFSTMKRRYDASHHHKLVLSESGQTSKRDERAKRSVKSPQRDPSLTLHHQSSPHTDSHLHASSSHRTAVPHWWRKGRTGGHKSNKTSNNNNEMNNTNINKCGNNKSFIGGSALESHDSDNTKVGYEDHHDDNKDAKIKNIKSERPIDPTDFFFDESETHPPDLASEADVDRLNKLGEIEARLNEVIYLRHGEVMGHEGIPAPLMDDAERVQNVGISTPPSPSSLSRHSSIVDQGQPHSVIDLNELPSGDDGIGDGVQRQGQPFLGSCERGDEGRLSGAHSSQSFNSRHSSHSLHSLHSPHSPSESRTSSGGKKKMKRNMSKLKRKVAKGVEKTGSAVLIHHSNEKSSRSPHSPRGGEDNVTLHSHDFQDAREIPDRPDRPVMGEVGQDRVSEVGKVSQVSEAGPVRLVKDPLNPFDA
eukprot:GHVN01011811.1.p1 GENE.GHVN01011811.1~~GHVN01011811.1.p1  ORF type:complete len:598 (-),score=193.31 GHVN01011811.1:158-1837(-)